MALLTWSMAPLTSQDTTKIQIPNISYLHRYWEVALSLRWEENIHGFLLERRVPCWRSSHLESTIENGKKKFFSNLNNVEFAPSSASDSKAEESGFLLVAFHLELDERSRVALDRLRYLALNAVQLHRSNHPDSGVVKF